MHCHPVSTLSTPRQISEWIQQLLSPPSRGVESRLNSLVSSTESTKRLQSYNRSNIRTLSTHILGPKSQQATARETRERDFNMNPSRFQHVSTGYGIIWESYGNHMGIIWESYGNHMGIIWESYGNHMGIHDKVLGRASC